MSLIKARLSVTLHANDVVVAESEDPALWQQVFSAINRGIVPKLPMLGSSLELPDSSGAPELPLVDSGDLSTPLGKLATTLGVSSQELIGACDPQSSEPYLHLDMHAWAAVKSQLPERGAKALSPIAVAGTLLALWTKEAGLGTATQAQAQKVLATISLQDKNPTRGIRSAAWLQARAGGQIVLNPAAIQKAILLAKCYCKQDWKPWIAADE
jgi:hypothetical protein